MAVFALIGVIGVIMLRKMRNAVYVQVGLAVLIVVMFKGVISIVEFTGAQREEALDATRARQSREFDEARLAVLNQEFKRPTVAESLNKLAGWLDKAHREGTAAPVMSGDIDFSINQVLSKDDPAIVASLDNLAKAAARATSRHQALEYYLPTAVNILRKNLPEGSPDLVLGLGNLADLYAAHPYPPLMVAGLMPVIGNPDRGSDAETYYREALAMARNVLPAGHPDLANTLSKFAQFLSRAGRDRQDVEALYREAWCIAQMDEDPRTLQDLQYTLLLFYDPSITPQSDPRKRPSIRRPLAIFFGKQAINLLQADRQNIQTLEQTAQQAFLKSKEARYRQLIRLLTAEERFPEAQQVLDMLKEQEYFDFLRRDAEADARQTLATLNPFEAQQAERIKASAAPLREQYREAEALRRIPEAARAPHQLERLNALAAILHQGQQHLAHVFDQVRADFDALSAAEQQRLTGQLHLPGDIQTLLRTLGSGVALAQYLVLDNQLHTLVTTAAGITAYEVRLDAAKLNAVAHEFYIRLRTPHADPRPVGEQLYRWLIEPMNRQLREAGIQTLMLYPDGLLRYLPFAALYDGQHYLAETYALAIYTAAARNPLASGRAAPGWQAAGLGVSQAHPGFNALPSVPGEIEGIIKRDVQDNDGVLPGDIYLDQAFTRERLQTVLQGGYSVVHLASHFAFQPGDESSSYLLLGDGSHLDLGQLRTGNYRFAGVDLVTLSACETALDSPGAQGQEVEGLGALVQKQGAQGVIATLWPVNDASTGQFMQHFYRLRQEGPLSKAEALRQAQLLFLRGASPAVAPYAHPFYWAPFILMGNWR